MPGADDVGGNGKHQKDLESNLEEVSVFADATIKAKLQDAEYDHADNALLKVPIPTMSVMSSPATIQSRPAISVADDRRMNRLKEASIYDLSFTLETIRAARAN